MPHDEFESITESGPLVDLLRARIEREGSITFRDFMDVALYHARHGYYATQPGATSRGGDYVTSPEVHPIFGALVARQLLEFWHALGRPNPFSVVEAGAGRGLLARDVVSRLARSDVASSLRYHIVEPIDRLRDEQRRTLDEANLDLSRITWSGELPGKIEGVVLSNELVDSFPVHRVLNDAGDLKEIRVGHRDGCFIDVPSPPSTPDLTRYFDALGLLPGDGCLAEVNLAALEWISRAGHALGRGYVLTFDYGYDAPDLYAPWRRDGTLLCFYRQSASSDPYQRIGKQDVTSSVDFTSFRRAGEDAGLATVALTDQAEFLVRLGISEGLATVARDRPEQLEEYFARRNVVLDLIDLARLGRVKVLLQAKDAPQGPFTGFEDA